MKKSHLSTKSFIKTIFSNYLLELEKLENSLNSDFDKLVNEILLTKGKIIFSSVGKSFYISQKIASSMSSLGKPSIAIHATELLHGDLGFISKKDLLIIMSHSGESEEVIKLCSHSNSLNIRSISITGYSKSTLSKSSFFNFSYPQISEVSINGLAPTTSSTLMLILGDLITIAVEKATNFSIKDYSKIHPEGAIGKSNSSYVFEFMTPFEKIPVVLQGSSMNLCLNIITKFKLGVVYITDNNNSFLGLITDGDIRRFLTNNNFSDNFQIDKVINTSYKSIKLSQTMLDANLVMISNNNYVNLLPVLDEEGKLVGSISMATFYDNGLKFIKK